MSVADDFFNVAPFQLLAPAVQRIGFVFNSPHSGSYYPQSFLDESCLDSLAIRRSEDCYVDELYAATAHHIGAPLLRAHFPRAYLDLNREAFELDQRMFHENLPPHVNSSSPRVMSGLGTIPRIVSEGQLIYPHKLSVETAFDRIEHLYKPYHATLHGLIERTRQHFGYALLIDCHSMPSGIQSGDHSRADFIIGDRYGRSSNIGLTACVIEILRSRGFAVAYNNPYAGGFITQHYGKPAHGIHALQIEANRNLYVNENSLIKHTGFEQLQSELQHLILELSSLPTELFAPFSIAAE